MKKHHCNIFLKIFIFLSVLSVHNISNAKSFNEKATQDLLKLSMNLRNATTAEISKALDSGADVNALNRWGVTTLLIASQSGKTGIVKALLKHRAKVDLADKDGQTPLWQASQNGHTKVVKMLIGAKANVNVKFRPQGVTPVFVASSVGRYDIVNLLIKAGADVNTQIKHRGIVYTPLKVARKYKHTKIAKLLEKNGAK